MNTKQKSSSYSYKNYQIQNSDIYNVQSIKIYIYDNSFYSNKKVVSQIQRTHRYNIDTEKRKKQFTKKN